MKNGRVVAVSSMQNDPVVTKAAELLRLDLMPSPEELRGGKVSNICCLLWYYHSVESL